MYYNFLLLFAFPIQTSKHKRSHRQKQPSLENKRKHLIGVYYVSELLSLMFYT